MFNVSLHLSFCFWLFLTFEAAFFFSAVCDAFRGSQGGESTNVNLCIFGAFRPPRRSR